MMKGFLLAGALLFTALPCPVTAAPPLQPGQGAHDFTLPDIFDENRAYSLGDFEGKVILINIWASWCPGCKEEMPLFFKIQDTYRDRGFRLLAVNIDNRKNKALKYLRRLEEMMGRKVNFTVLFDGEKGLSKKYNPFGLPATYLIDRKGNLVKSYIGSFTGKNIGSLTSDIEGVLGGER